MSKYQEATVAGTSWVRASEVKILNGQDSKGILFKEEKITVLEDGSLISREYSQISEGFNAENASTAFPLLSPETGEPLADGAQMTYEGVYAALYSLYLHLATERDSVEATPEEPVEEEVQP